MSQFENATVEVIWGDFLRFRSSRTYVRSGPVLESRPS